MPCTHAHTYTPTHPHTHTPTDAHGSLEINYTYSIFSVNVNSYDKNPVNN